MINLPKHWATDGSSYEVDLNCTGNLSQNWDMDSNEDNVADEDLGADPDPDVITTYDRASEDEVIQQSTSNSGRHPSRPWHEVAACAKTRHNGRSLPHWRNAPYGR